MVNVDCGSYTPEGVNAIADLCQARFERGGWAVERMRHEPTGDQERLGDFVIGRLDGGGRARVLMIGHTEPGKTLKLRSNSVDGVAIRIAHLATERYT
jgi:hypothetical protein